MAISLVKSNVLSLSADRQVHISYVISAFESFDSALLMNSCVFIFA